MSIISDVEEQVRQRLAELEPLVEEHRQLTAVLRTFEQARHRTEAGATASPRPAARRRGASARHRTGVRPGGSRADQAIALITARPGITAAEAAEEMGIGTTYLYRVLPALEKEGKVRKDGTGYFLGDAAVRQA